MSFVHSQLTREGGFAHDSIRKLISTLLLIDLSISPVSKLWLLLQLLKEVLKNLFILTSIYLLQPAWSY